MQNKIMLPLLW